MKKYIFTENQIKKIIDNQINEQSGTFYGDEIAAINSGSEEFLKLKGINGIDLTDKIKKYQKMIGCEQTGHMLDCVDLMKTKYRKDFIMWKNSIQKNKPFLDKAGDAVKNTLMKIFGIQPNPDEIY